MRRINQTNTHICYRHSQNASIDYLTFALYEYWHVIFTYVAITGILMEYIYAIVAAIAIAAIAIAGYVKKTQRTVT